MIPPPTATPATPFRNERLVVDFDNSPRLQIPNSKSIDHAANRDIGRDTTRKILNPHMIIERQEVILHDFNNVCIYNRQDAVRMPRKTIETCRPLQ
jgi:hypothetical protein